MDLKKNKKNKPVRVILIKSRKVFLYMGLFSMIANCLVLVSPIYMMQLYDRVLGTQKLETLYALTLIMLYLYVIYCLVEMVRSKLLIKLGINFDRHLSEKAVSAMFRSKVFSNGVTVVNGVKEVETLKQFFSSPALFSFFDMPFVPFFIMLNFLLNPILGYISILAVIIIFSFAVLTEISSRDLMDKASVFAGQAGQFMDSSLKNYEALESMGMFEGIKNKWQKKHQPRVLLQSQANDRLTSIAAVTKGFRLFIQSAVLGVGAYLVLIQEATPGIMIGASIILGKALQPVEQSIGSWRQFIGARQSYHKLNEMLSYVEENDGGQENMSLPIPMGKLSVEGMSYAVQIPGTMMMMPILKQVQFSLQSGEILGIIGGSGAGKSTLARALIGVAKPSSGSVTLDGVKIYQWDKKELGPHIGYVPQDVEIFPGTVKENISRFAEEADDEAIVLASKIAGCHEMLLGLTKGYDTEVGYGNVLSGGQRQLVAIARAIYNSPKFILFDEPNSNLDSTGEAALVNTLNYLKQQKTTAVLVVHKHDYLRFVDKLLVLQSGQQVAFGPRDQVLAELQKNNKQAQEKKAKQSTAKKKNDLEIVEQNILKKEKPKEDDEGEDKK